MASRTMNATRTRTRMSTLPQATIAAASPKAEVEEITGTRTNQPK
jgi:hypothetical protein